jgi:excisionase family DNA binding protein
MNTLLTVEEAAAALHATVTVSAIRAAIREGRLAATRIGKRYYVEERVLRRFAACPDRASRPASGAAPAMAPGSSSTGASSIGQAIAERAAADLLKMRSKSTSPPSGKKAAAGQRSPTR